MSQFCTRHGSSVVVACENMWLNFMSICLTRVKFIPMNFHYNDVIMGAMASQITSLTIVYSTVYSGEDQREHESSASLAFVENVSIWWRHHVDSMLNLLWEIDPFIQYLNWWFRLCCFADRSDLCCGIYALFIRYGLWYQRKCSALERWYISDERVQ